MTGVNIFVTPAMFKGVSNANKTVKSVQEESKAVCFE